MPVAFAEPETDDAEAPVVAMSTEERKKLQVHFSEETEVLTPCPISREDLYESTKELLKMDPSRKGNCSVKLTSSKRKPSFMDYLGEMISCCISREDDNSAAPPAPEGSRASDAERRKSLHIEEQDEHGIMWKLNHRVAENTTDEGLRDLTNWRRRDFFMTQHEKELLMVYTSGKENGHLQLAAHLDETTKIEAPLDCVILDALDKPTLELVQNAMLQYDVAFVGQGKKRFAVASDYDIPEELFTMHILWQDKDGEQHKMILGTSRFQREVWMKVLSIRISRLQAKKK